MESIAELPQPSDVARVIASANEAAFEQVADVLGCKWTVAILDALERGVNRPGRLQRELPGLTAKVLNQRIRKLSRMGLIVRHAHPEIPPRVEYEFTDRGLRMAEVLRAVRKFAEAADETR
jgi:DNA-binding HxlR family transcriptional regulator